MTTALVKQPSAIPAKRSAVEDKNRTEFLSRILSRWDYGRELATERDFRSLLRAYRHWVYICANKNTTAVASTPIRLYIARGVKEDNNTPKAVTKIIPKKRLDYLMKSPSVQQLPQVKKAYEIEEIIDDHPFLDLMQNVNGHMNSFDLWETTELFQELCGNAYWYIVKNRLGFPMEIWPVMPDSIRIVPDPDNFIGGYIFTNDMEKVKWEEDLVIHFKFPSATSYYYGTSPLSAVTAEYNIYENMNIYENALFANMGRLEGAFETDQSLEQFEFERLKKEVKEMFTGAHNVGKSPLLEKGVSFKAYSYAPKDMAFLQGRKSMKEAICNAYGQSLGMYDKDATRANAEAATYNFAKDAVLPRCTRLEQKINEQLMPMFGENLFVAFDNPVPEDEEMRLREIESHLRTGYSCINEEREYDNKDTVDWGDIPLLPPGMAPLQVQSVNVPGQMPPPTIPEQEEPTVPEGQPISDVEVEAFVLKVVDKIRNRIAPENGGRSWIIA